MAAITQIKTHLDFGKVNELQNAIIQNIAGDAGTPNTGQIWFNSSNTRLTIYDGSGNQILVTPSSTDTLTNKTFDANGTGNSLSNVEVADFATGVIDTELSSVSASDDTLASAKALKAYIDNRTYDNISYRPPVDLVFNDNGNALPATTATTIDNVTVVDGMRVLVLDSSTAGQISNIYLATVDTGNITWTVQQDGTGADAPEDGHTVWIKSGNIYADQRNSFNGTVWVQTSGTGSVPDSSTTVKGIVELATTAEAEAKTDTARAVTPSGLTTFTRKYAAAVTGTSGTITAATHGLGATRDLLVQLQEDGTPNKPLIVDIDIASNGDVSWEVNGPSITGRIVIIG